MASKITPEPVAVAVPVCPVVGSVEVIPSATIVTTAGLTVLTMSTTGVCPAATATSVFAPAGALVTGRCAALTAR